MGILLYLASFNCQLIIVKGGTSPDINCGAHTINVTFNQHGSASALGTRNLYYAESAPLIIALDTKQALCNSWY